jgi:hypothetical protein
MSMQVYFFILVGRLPSTPAARSGSEPYPGPYIVLLLVLVIVLDLPMPLRER